MTKRKAPPAKPLLPRQGGSFIRAKDGSLAPDATPEAPTTPDAKPAAPSED